jgi:hypothetical protein
MVQKGLTDKGIEGKFRPVDQDIVLQFRGNIILSA